MGSHCPGRRRQPKPAVEKKVLKRNRAGKGKEKSLQLREKGPYPFLKGGGGGVGGFTGGGGGRKRYKKKKTGRGGNRLREGGENQIIVLRLFAKNDVMESGARREGLRRKRGGKGQQKPYVVERG